MKKIRYTAILLYVLLAANITKAQEQPTAHVNISIVNYPFLIVENHTFFKEDQEIKVKKVEENLFTLDYYGKKPRLFYINFRAVLISPGDSVDFVHKTLDADPDHFRDTLIAKGTNNCNYVFSNSVNDPAYRRSYPNYRSDSYQKNVKLYVQALKENNKKLSEDPANLLKKQGSNAELSDFLIRDAKIKFLSDLVNFEDVFKDNPSQKQVLHHLTDSLFKSADFLKTDVSYNQDMEFLFKNYFSSKVSVEFNGLKSQKDYSDVAKYIKEQQNDFVRDYFVYFLVTDYNYPIALYKTTQMDGLIKTNPHIGKIRNQLLDKSHIYK